MAKRSHSHGVARPPAPKDEQPENLTTREPDTVHEDFEDEDFDDDGGSQELTEITPTKPKPKPEASTPAPTSAAPPAGSRTPNTDNDKSYAIQMREALKAAKEKDKNKPADKRGWRTPFDMKIPGAAAKRIADSGAPVETMTMPNAQHFPETGVRYRLK